jgi:hypothetical protein
MSPQVLSIATEVSANGVALELGAGSTDGELVCAGVLVGLLEWVGDEASVEVGGGDAQPASVATTPMAISAVATREVPRSRPLTTSFIAMA